MPSTANSTSAELKTPRPKYGEVLALRREEVGFARQVEVSQRSFELAAEATEHFESFSQQWLSRLEADQTGERIDAANRRKLRTLSYLLGWNGFDFEHHVGVPVGTVPGLGEVGERNNAALLMQGTNTNLRVRLPAFVGLGKSIEAVRQNGMQHTYKYKYVDPSELPVGTNPGRLFFTRTEGADLFEVGMPQSIPQGAWLLVEADRLPSNGQLVLAYLPEQRLGVVKHQQHGEGVILRSYQIGGPLLWARDYPEMQVTGVVKRVSFDL